MVLPSSALCSCLGIAATLLALATASLEACIEEEVWPTLVERSDLSFTGHDTLGNEYEVPCEFFGTQLLAEGPGQWRVQHQACHANNWGNLLSVYWHARGVARLAGATFESSGFDGSILRFLPRRVTAEPELADVGELARVCEKCQGWKAAHPHACQGGWVSLRSRVQQETQAALRAFAAEAIGGRSRERARVGDVVVHLRLDLRHPMQRWPGRSSFEAEGVLPRGTRRVLLVHQAFLPEHFEVSWTATGDLGHVHHDAHMTDKLQDRAVARGLKHLLAGYRELLQLLCGTCEVSTETGSQSEDFLRLATAPVLFCTGSSFCLWAAMGNEGEVHFPVGVGAHWAGHGAEKPDLGHSWHWRREPRLGNQDINMFTSMTPEQMVAWIWSN